VWDSSRVKGRGEPIGYLQAGSVVGRAFLVLLPYNYPRLVPLIKQAVDAGSAQGNLTNLPVKWRPDFNQYLGCLPPYYCAPLKRALRKLGVASQVQEVKGGGLSQVAMRRLQRYAELSQEESQRLEQVLAAKEEVQFRRMDASGIGKAGEHGVPALGIDLGGVDLVSVWESSRQRLFGERGLTVMGLHVRGVEGRNGVCSKDMQQNPARACLLTEAGVGAALMPSSPVLDMGYYHHKLARSELLRDPSSEPETDEDTYEGIMRRRLTVDFGNPFHPQLVARGGGPSRISVDEAADEARVLSPHILNEDVNGSEGHDEEGLETISEGGEDGAAMDVDGGGSNANSQSSKKRQRLTELPSLPIHKKIRRHSPHRPQQATPDLTSVPLASAVVNVNGDGASPPQPSPSALSSMITPGLNKPSIVTAPSPPPMVMSEQPSPGNEAEEGELEVEEGEEPEPRNLRIVAPPATAGGSGLQPSSSSTTNDSALRSPRDSSTAAPVPHSPKVSQQQQPPQDHNPRPTGTIQQQPQQQVPQPSQQKQPPGPQPVRPLPVSSRQPSLPQPVGGQQPPSSPVVPSASVPPHMMRPNEQGWLPAFSRRENRPYYFNINTKKSFWETPPGCIPLVSFFG